MKFSFSLVLLLALVLFACNKPDAPDCFQRAGSIVSEYRQTENFHTIEIRDNVQIELYDSTRQFVLVTAPRNLLSDVTTEVENGILRICDRNTCNIVRSYKHRIVVRIYSPDFSNIQHYGTGDITAINTLNGATVKMESHQAAGTFRATLQVDTATFLNHTGTNDIYCKGTSSVTQLFSQGLGIIDAHELISQFAFVNNSSINDVYVNSNGYLFCYLAFSGNIYYSGIPNLIDEQNEGSGSVMPKP